jgi:hypothetical protein
VLLLNQGQSFLGQPLHAYRAFTFDLVGKRNSYNCIEPIRAEDLSRIYPHRIGMLGCPGNAFVIVRMIFPRRDVEWEMGYIGWDGYPVWSMIRYTQQGGNPKTWIGRPQPIWLGPYHIAALKDLVDRRTWKVVELTSRNEAERSYAEASRKRAIKQRQAALNSRREKERERKRRLKAERAAAHARWANPILENLRSVQVALLCREHLRRLETTEQWL